jgi:orotidine-5'-phosphate decarboxylase
MSEILGKTIVALDGMNEKEVFDFLERPENTLPTVKLGLELFCRLGPNFVRELHARTGKDIFLDLKLHDIPNTVASSIRALAGLPVKFLTLHLSGGEEMLKAAVAEAKKSLPTTTLLGVSYLTSLGESDLKDMWEIESGDNARAFERLFALAFRSGMPGIVCSAHELELVRSLEQRFGRALVKVCPGIRFDNEIASGSLQDQKRVLSPKKALSLGADYLVMGRPLTKAQDLGARIAELGQG